MRFLCETLSILRAVVADHVMLARHIEDLAGLEALQVLLERVEFFRLGKMAQVAGVQDEVGRSSAAR